MKRKLYIRKLGTHLRVRVYSGKYRPTKFRYHDVGSKKHTQRISAYHPKKGWFTYGWIFKLSDVKNRRKKTMTVLRRLGIKERDLVKLGL